MKNIRTATELRNEAWTAMSTSWPTVLSVTAMISLISWMASLMGSALGILGSLLILVVQYLLVVPQIGLVRGMIDHLRGTPIAFSCFSSMWSYTKQIICCILWQSLCLFGWVLLGYLPMIFALFFIGAGTDYTVMSAIFVVISVVLMMVLMVRAMLNYALVPPILADHPTMGAAATVDQSKQMMKGNRWRLVKMELPLMLIYALIIAISAFLINALGESIFVNLIISVLTIAPTVMELYFAPVLYEELRSAGAAEEPCEE